MSWIVLSVGRLPGVCMLGDTGLHKNLIAQLLQEGVVTDLRQQHGKG